MVVRRISSNSELYHHGIKGQEWGDRNGPPYPLDSSPQKQAAKKKKVGLVQKIKNKKKGKQLKKAREEKKKFNEQKEQLIKSGDVDAIKKYQVNLSDEELARAVSRAQLTIQLETLNNTKTLNAVNKGKSYLESIASTANTVSSIAQSVGNVKKVVDQFSGTKESADTKLANEVTRATNKAKLKILNGTDQDKINQLIGLKNESEKQDKKDKKD